MIKRFFMSVVATFSLIIALTILLLSSCGGKKDSPEFQCGKGSISVTVASGSTSTTSQYTVDSATSKDDYITARVSTTYQTWVDFCGARMSNGVCNLFVIIKVLGTSAPADYPVTGAYRIPTYLEYKSNAADIYSSSSGTVTLTSIGDVNQQITGSFDTVVNLESNASTTLGVSGTFNIARCP